MENVTLLNQNAILSLMYANFLFCLIEILIRERLEVTDEIQYLTQPYGYTEVYNCYTFLYLINIDAFCFH